MLIWTLSDVIAVSFFALASGALVVLWLFELSRRAARRIRNSFRNLWNRTHG